MRQVLERSMLKPAQVEIGIQFSIEPFQNVQIEGRCDTQAVVVSPF
jgi:hypothetical protein